MAEEGGIRSGRMLQQPGLRGESVAGGVGRQRSGDCGCHCPAGRIYFAGPSVVEGVSETVPCSKPMPETTFSLVDGERRCSRRVLVSTVLCVWWSIVGHTRADEVAPPGGGGLRGWLPGGWVQQPGANPNGQRRTPPARTRAPRTPAGEAVAEPRPTVTLHNDAQIDRSFQQIEAFIEREKWPEVVAGLQQLVEGGGWAGDTFVPRTRQDWTSSQRAAQQRIATLPPAGLRLYQQVYGPVAGDLRTAARLAGDIERLADVARRFLNTPAGAAAAEDVALAYFDRGDYLACVRWIERVPGERRTQLSPLTQTKYALALWASGRRADAERVIAASAGVSAGAMPGSAAGESLASWWRAAPKPALHPAVPQSSWPVAGGNAAHAGLAPASAPLLLEEWALPMTYVPAVRSQIESLAADLRDAGRACLPAAQAVVIGNRLAVRTLRGVEVLELSTGQTLWGLPRDEASPERLLSGVVTGTGEQRALQLRIVGQVQYADAGDYDQHPLTSLLYRDGVTGALSSDGRRLFALTEQAQLGRTNYGYWLGPQEEEADPFQRDWGTNVLAAYDLETGVEQWQIGGRRTGEAFERPLAGTYFFGPPVAVEQELYVVGERDNEVTLFVLDAESGRPLLTQPLASSQARVEVDATRRLWNCQPAVAEGVVVCPTTAGWTVAVDRLERRLLWAHSCEPLKGSNPQQQGAGAVVHPLHPLNVRWEPTPPMIVGRQVFITPPELPDAFFSQEPLLLCLDLETGREVWRAAKSDDGLYVGGVTDRAVLVVGRGRLRALATSTGDELWSLTLPVDQSPSGRGVISGEDFLLPLSGGALWVVKLADGSVRDRQQLPDHVSALGNLILSQGRLISVEPLSVRCFAEATALDAEIARRRSADPQDGWATLRQAQVHCLRGELAAAAELLDRNRGALPAGESAEQAERDALLLECLAELVREDWLSRDREFARLTELADPRQDAEIRRLAIERAMARGETETAWGLLWPSPALSGRDELLRFDRLEVHELNWESGRLAQLYAQGAPPLRDRMDAAFASAVEAADAGGQLRLERLLGFHEMGRRLTARLAEAAERAGDVAGAEIRWRRLWQSPDASGALTAGVRLADWLARQRLTVEPRQLLAEVERRSAELPADVRSSVLEQVQRCRSERHLDAAATDDSLASTDWSAAEYVASVGRRRPQDQSPQDVLAASHPVDARDEFHWQFLPQTQRLRVLTREGAEWWSLPLRTPARQLFDQSVGLRLHGAQAYSVWQGVVQALSLPDRLVRWTYPIDLRMSGANYVRNVQVEENRVLLPADQFAQQWSLRRFRAPAGMVAAADAQGVLLHGRRGISRLDALTGEVQWTRTGLSPQTMVYADGDRIYGLPADDAQPFILQAVDGTEVPNDILAREAARVIAIGGGVLTVLESRAGGFFGLFGPRCRLRGVDAASGAEVWQRDLDGRVRLGWLTTDELLCLAPDGALSALQVQAGSLRELGRLPADMRVDAGPVEMVADAERLFLLFDRKWRHWSDHVTLPNAQINGELVCFDRAGAGLQWRRSIQEQRLLLPHFTQLPVLIFFNQASEDPLQQLRISLWDKGTGRALLDEAELSVSPQTYQLEVDIGARALHLLGHTLQIDVAPRPAPPDDLPSP